MNETTFWSKVDASGDCWIWTGRIHPKGYGRVEFGGRQEWTHRLAWQLLYGLIDPELTIDHRCLNKPCLNPLHLEVVTRAENGRRGILLKPRKDVCGRGHPKLLENVYADGRCRLCVKDANSRGYQRRKVAAILLV